MLRRVQHLLLLEGRSWGVCRSFATISRPQELHRHRKRLENFGRDVSRGHAETLAACGQLLTDTDWFARKVAVETIAKVSQKGDETQLSLLYTALEERSQRRNEKKHVQKMKNMKCTLRFLAKTETICVKTMCLKRMFSIFLAQQNHVFTQCYLPLWKAFHASV
eukprot:Skav217726  [mRNA]  locus=scaffold308:156170:159683:- [translate_table: standard]